MVIGYSCIMYSENMSMKNPEGPKYYQRRIDKTKSITYGDGAVKRFRCTHKPVDGQDRQVKIIQ